MMPMDTPGLAEIEPWLVCGQSLGDGVQTLCLVTNMEAAGGSCLFQSNLAGTAV